MSVTIASKKINPIGFGLMGFLLPGKDISFDDAIEVMKHALNAGANFWDAGEFYGTEEKNTLHLLNAYFTKYPEDASKVFISVKGCFDRSLSNMCTNDEKGVQKSIENCLRVLDGKCKIDLFQAS
jgi:pyridoxine 4-dehydrogenase